MGLVQLHSNLVNNFQQSLNFQKKILKGGLTPLSKIQSIAEKTDQFNNLPPKFDWGGDSWIGYTIVELASGACFINILDQIAGASPMRLTHGDDPASCGSGGETTASN